MPRKLPDTETVSQLNVLNQILCFIIATSKNGYQGENIFIKNVNRINYLTFLSE